MRIVPLTPERACEIHALADTHSPFCLSTRDLAENLAGLEEDGCNFCFGVEDGGQLCGYMMAWVDNSRVDGRAEDVVLVDDVQLQPAARRYLYNLFKEVLGAMRSCGHRGLPVEGTLRQTVSEETFTAHPEIMESLGYHLADTRRYRDEALEEDLTWVRFEPFEGPPPIPTDDDPEDPPAPPPLEESP